MRWTRQRPLRSFDGRAGLLARERSAARQTNDAEAYGKTVWSWHPLLVSSRRRFLRSPTGRANTTNSPMTEASRIRLRGELGISRKTIAQGMPECSVCTCMLVCVFYAHYCTRDRGCSKHPAFPAPSSLWAKRFAKPGRNAPRERGGVCPGRMDFQCLWLDAGEMLPVISDPSSEMRQAATPKNAVSIKAATSKTIEENWLTS
jgi:hypothetical protein